MFAFGAAKGMKAFMFKDDFITIEMLEDGYVIKDEKNMVIAKLEVIEYSSENRRCTYRLYFYISEGSYEYISYIIRKLVNIMFDTVKLFKINLLINENLNIQPFFDLNFHIEGVITNNILINNKYKNEILLGIDQDIYKNLKKVTTLTLQGKKVHIKIFTPNDAIKVLNYYKKNKEYLREFEELKDEGFYTLERQMILIRQQYIQFLNGSSASFGIFINEKMVGIIHLYNLIGGIFKDGTIGYSIDESEQGKGYMKEAVKLVCDYAFNILKLHRLQATTLVDNIKSKAVLKACGFKEIGISEKYLFINGRWQDQCVFYKITPLCYE